MNLGLIVGVLGILQVTSLETTVGLVLVALAAVAGSLRADRSLREQLEGAVNRLDEKLVLVSRALSSPLPYEVVSGHYKWDFEPGGKVAKVSKKARIRFVNNGVWTILQWHSNGVDVREPKAHRLTEQGHKQRLSVLQGPTDPPLQRVGKLVAFDRECGLDDGPGLRVRLRVLRKLRRGAGVAQYRHRDLDRRPHDRTGLGRGSPAGSDLARGRRGAHATLSRTGRRAIQDAN